MVVYVYTAICIITTMILPGEAAMKIDIEPKQIVAFVNQNVTILCRAGVALQFCRVTLPGQLTALTLSPKTRYNREFNYYGNGLENGECGVNLPAVTEKYNGPVSCGVGTEEDPSETSATMQLTVARSPNTPDLDVSPSSSGSNEYREGEMITATCTVKDGRPAATIAWYLGDEQIYSDKRVVDIVDAKTDLHTAVQNITRRLNWNDNTKLLKCLGKHLAYGSKKNMTVKQMLVRYAPRDVTQPIEQFGFIIGQTGEVVVEILANPQPQFTWMIGNNRLQEGDRDAAGIYEAAQAEFLGGGKWKAILFINKVTMEDAGKDYYLNAKNKEGEKTYRVVISTTSQPIVASLGCGAIIGITLAVVGCVIVLPLIVLVVIFWQKNRKCSCQGKTVGKKEEPEGIYEEIPDNIVNRPGPSHIQFMVDAKADPGYIESVVIVNPQFDSRLAQDGKPQVVTSPSVKDAQKASSAHLGQVNLRPKKEEERVFYSNFPCSEVAKQAGNKEEPKYLSLLGDVALPK